MQFFRKREPKLTVRWLSENMVDIPSLGFFGSYIRSPNGVFALAWCDADLSGRVGGYRTKGHGRYVLLKEDQVATYGELERPNDGNVSNNGVFVLNDWLFGGGPRGIFYVFDSQGEEILRHRFEANLYNNGISADGTHAVCQLCNSPHSDGGTLAFFNLTQRKLMWQKVPEIYWASLYEFDVERKVLSLQHPEYGAFAFSFEGEFLDTSRWENTMIEKGSGFEVLKIAKEKLTQLGRESSSTTNEPSVILRILDIAHGRLEEYPKERARVERAKGEVYELLGKAEAAIKCYETALELNPKVGVKRRLEALKNEKQ